MHALCRRWICVGQGGCHSGPDATSNTLTRSGCTDQRAKRVHCIGRDQAVGGSLLQQWRFWAFPSRGTPLLHAEKPNTMMGLPWCLLNTKRKERQNQVIYDTLLPSPVLLGLCCARRVRYRACCFIDCPLWLFSTSSSRSTHHETNQPCAMHNPPHYEALLNELSTQEVRQS